MSTPESPGQKADRTRERQRRRRLRLYAARKGPLRCGHCPATFHDPRGLAIHRRIHS